MNDVSDLNDNHLALALKKASNPIFIVNKAGITVWCNQAYAKLLGEPLSNVVGKPAPSLIPNKENAKFFLKLWSMVLEGQTWFGELQEKKADGTIIHVDVVFTPLEDANGRPTLFLVLEHDITNRKIEYEKVWQLANYDRLTGLANRSYLTSMLERIVTQAERNQKKVAFLFIDLDGFKGVNDSLGHEGGDMVLIEAARVLQQHIRKTDIVARLGGDEFACILDDIESAEAAQMVAQKMVDAVAAIKKISLGSVDVGASIGIAMYPEHGLNQTDIRMAADAAMYEAKRAGKRCFRIYEPPPAG